MNDDEAIQSMKNAVVLNATCTEPNNHMKVSKSCGYLPSQHSLVTRFKGNINGLPLWMERTDFSTAFPTMLAAS